MEKVESFKHLNDTITPTLVSHLYVNAFPKTSDYRRLMLQIMTNLKQLLVLEDILYINKKKPLTTFEIPHKDFVSGDIRMYEIIKKLNSQTNIYEGREKLGKSVHPRWIFFPYQDENNSIVFTFFFEKIINKGETDITQKCIEESQAIYDRIKDGSLSKDILSEGVESDLDSRRKERGEK